MHQPAESISILYVDGNPDGADATATALERELPESSILTSTTAEKALELLNGGGIECVVSEFDLPDQSGINLLESVRSKHPNIPFILFTDAGSEDTAAAAVSAGASDYLQKGEDQYSALADRIDDAVGSNRDGFSSSGQGSASSAYRDLFIKADDGIVITDPETGTLIEANQRFASMLEYDREDLRGKTIEALSADDPSFNQAAAMERIEQVLAGKPQQFEWLLERSDGTHTWSEVNLKRTTIDDTVRLIAFVREISDRKEREAELEFLEAMVETIGVGAAAYRADGSFEYINQAFAEMLNTSRDRLAEASVWELDPALDRDQFDTYWASFEDGETRTAETVYSFEGTQIPVETVTTCTEIEGRRYHFGTVQDITDRKEQERRFQAFVEQSNDIISVLGEGGIYEYQSPSVERILGYQPDELIGESAFDYVHPEDREEVIAEFERAVGNPEEVLVVEYRFRHADGSWRWLESRGYNEASEQETERFVVNSRDVTERRRHERQIGELHESTRRMVEASTPERVSEIAVETAEAILDHPIAAIWLVDESGTRLEPVAHTDEAKNMFGEHPVYTPGNSLSWQAFETDEVIVSDDLQTSEHRFNPDTPIKSELILPLGEYGVMNIGSRVHDSFSENDIIHAKLLAANTQVALGRGKRERMLERQTDQMEFFNSILRHDVLNAVTVIKSRAEFLKAELEGDQLRDAETIIRWSEDVEEIVQRVRTVLDTLTGDGDPELRAVAIGPELIAELHRIRLAYPDVTFTTDIPDGVAVLANDLLGDVLGNIITNAVDHNVTEDLEVTTTVEATDETITLRVADNGRGIDDDRKEAVFRRGETGHAKSIGSGFGLFFVDVMVSEYGGDVWVEDNDNGGATVVVQLVPAEQRPSR